MKFAASIAAFALAACVAAAPTPSGDWQNNNCYPRSYIEGLIAQEIVFLQHLDVATGVAAGQAIFADNLTEVSLLFPAHIAQHSRPIVRRLNQLPQR